MRVVVKRGLDLPLKGSPEQRIGPAPPVRHAAVLGADYPGVRPSMAVSVNQKIRCGELLFTSRRDPRIRITAPAAGTVSEINRGAKRSLTSVVIRISGSDAVRYPAMSSRDASDESKVVARLLEAGLWLALRARPFDRIPSPDSRPEWLFITAIDTDPLAPDPAVVLAEAGDAFADGLRALSVLSRGPVYVCHAPGSVMPTPSDLPNVTNVEFAGPHPAGLAGTHIHHLAEVTADRAAWYINYQDVIAAGRLVHRGEVDASRVMAVAGDGLTRPRLVRTVIGASTDELLRDERTGKSYVLSGSVLSGREVSGASAYVGRLHHQVTVLGTQDKHPGLLAYLSPARWWRRKRIVARPHSKSRTGFMPIEGFERVWPMAAPPIPLLRALLARDVETAEALDCLELAEADLALCEYLCPANENYGIALRKTLDAIAAQG